jgi:hypothetical protein
MKKKHQGLHFLRKPQKEPNKGRQKTKKERKTHTGMNKSASLTPVQGPSTVVSRGKVWNLLTLLVNLLLRTAGDSKSVTKGDLF